MECSKDVIDALERYVDGNVHAPLSKKLHSTQTFKDPLHRVHISDMFIDSDIDIKNMSIGETKNN